MPTIFRQESDRVKFFSSGWNETHEKGFPPRKRLSRKICATARKANAPAVISIDALDTYKPAGASRELRRHRNVRETSAYRLASARIGRGVGRKQP
jgi:hypothetical protein